MKKIASRKKQKVRWQDPYKQREASKYDRPIPSREYILQLLKSSGTPLTAKEIRQKLGVEEEIDIRSLNRRLRAMERDGQLLLNRQNRYCLINSKDLIRGTVLAHPDGFGFLRPDSGGEDLFLPPKQMRALINEDRVVVRVSGIDRRGRKEAAVVEVLERNTELVVGRFFQAEGIQYVIPFNKKITHEILIPNNAINGALDQQAVVVRIVQQPQKHRQPIGTIDEVLGDHGIPGMETEITIKAYGIPDQWSEPVLREANHLERTFNTTSVGNRVDLRHLPLVTIDGEDAKDFDDAVYCERKQKGWRLLVAIADVSHFVKFASELDSEAKNRGNSVYFPNKVIPMLPEVLSNQLCSLKPDEDRLVLVCELFVSNEGKIFRSKFFEGLMRSHARLTYTEVASAVVEKNSSQRRRLKGLVPYLDELYRLFKAFDSNRAKRGVMEFDSEEAKIVFDGSGQIKSIEVDARNDAHKIIEECMIAANIAAARFLRRHKITHLVRAHEGPSTEKLADLRTFLGELGLFLCGGEQPNSIDYARLLTSIKGRVDAHLIQSVILRSMSQAIYRTGNHGHFGLALESYTHFTSPIRRYPDLLVHRAIRHCLQRKKLADFPYEEDLMSALGEHCSVTERRADEATREVINWLKCQYMRSKLGQEFAGVISHVTSFGFFVELDTMFIEGLVHVSNLGRDYFHFDPISHRLLGERTGSSFRLGDSVRVLIAQVDPDEKKIDLELVTGKQFKKRRRKTKR